jgi:hypothetical protein
MKSLLLSRPKWQLMLYESRAGGGEGGRGSMHGENFFPLSSLDFSIDFTFKANCWRITFLHMEKGPLHRMEGLCSLETKKKSFREWTTFHYQQQIFAGLELEIYKDLLKKDKIFLQCIHISHNYITPLQNSHATVGGNAHNWPVYECAYTSPARGFTA